MLVYALVSHATSSFKCTVEANLGSIVSVRNGTFGGQHP